MKVEEQARVYVAVGVTDLRKAVNGLSILVQQQMRQDPFGGAYFAFSNRGRNRVKVLYWDRNGFCLWQLCEASHNCHYAKCGLMRRRPGDWRQRGYLLDST